KPFRLRVGGFDFTEKFTKTLFLRLDMSPDLIALRIALGLPATNDYDPHLSLLYRKLPTARKADLARQAALPLETVLFDRLAAVSCPDPTSSRADVESWKILATHPLHTPPATEAVSAP
ncbi:MAG: 2'-5' RNA ligase family protein, partial [Chthoniobacterales bacterium]